MVPFLNLEILLTRAKKKKIQIQLNGQRRTCLSFFDLHRMVLDGFWCYLVAVTFSSKLVLSTSAPVVLFQISGIRDNHQTTTELEHIIQEEVKQGGRFSLDRRDQSGASSTKSSSLKERKKTERKSFLVISLQHYLTHTSHLNIIRDR